MTRPMVMDALPLWAPDLPSDGLCLDTPLGDVDLVAVDLAQRGHRVTLTAAELVFLAERVGSLTAWWEPDVQATRDLIGEGLGLTGKAVAALFTRLLHGAEG